MGEGVPLEGGNMTGVVRFGEYVHRASGVWTPAVHRLLEYLVSSGIAWVPRPAGFDERGREILTYLSGAVPHDPMPAWVWTDTVMIDAVRRLAQLHDATSGYRDPRASWQLPAHEPQEVICHNDFVPYNMVFDTAHQLVGVIDWDTASPGPRVWDLAYLAYRMVPLSAPGNADSIDSPLIERRRRLDLLCRTYAHGETPTHVIAAAIQRLHELAEFTARRAAAGATHVAGHVELYRSAAEWLDRSTDHLIVTLN